MARMGRDGDQLLNMHWEEKNFRTPIPGPRLPRSDSIGRSSLKVNETHRNEIPESKLYYVPSDVMNQTPFDSQGRSLNVSSHHEVITSVGWLNSETPFNNGTANNKTPCNINNNNGRWNNTHSITTGRHLNEVIIGEPMNSHSKKSSQQDPTSMISKKSARKVSYTPDVHNALRTNRDSHMSGGSGATGGGAASNRAYKPHRPRSKSSQMYYR